MMTFIEKNKSQIMFQNFQSDIKQWQLVFIVPVCVYFFTNLIFIIFGTSEKQEWDTIKGNW